MSTSRGVPALPGSDDDAGAGPAVRSLFARLVDDAAVFPPASTAMGAAVPAHRRHARSWYGDIVGPFLVPAAGTAAFAQAAAGLVQGPAVRAAVVADPRSPDPLAGAIEALAALDRLDGVEPVAVEVPLPAGTDQAGAAADLLPRLRRSLPAGLRAWVEVHRAPGWRDALRRVAAAGEDVGAKLRAGGTTPPAFPTVDELAAFLRAAVDADATFKLTAGLHTAVRGPDAVPGAVHHGVLNVVCAVRAALTGAQTPEIAGVLGETRAAPLASATRRMSEADAAVLRAFLASFGCCDLADPIGDLAALGLVEQGAA